MKAVARKAMDLGNPMSQEAWARFQQEGLENLVDLRHAWANARDRRWETLSFKRGDHKKAGRSLGTWRPGFQITNIGAQSLLEMSDFVGSMLGRWVRAPFLSHVQKRGYGIDDWLNIYVSICMSCCSQ